MTEHDAKRASALLQALVEAEAQIRSLKAELAETRRMPVPTPAAEVTRPSILSIEEACDELRISRSSIYKLLNEGELSSIRIGKRRRIPREAIDSLIARNRVGRPSPAR